MNPNTHPVGFRGLYETENTFLGFNDRLLVEFVVHEWSPCGQFVRTGNPNSDTTTWRRATEITPVAALNNL